MFSNFQRPTLHAQALATAFTQLLILDATSIGPQGIVLWSFKPNPYSWCGFRFEVRLMSDHTFRATASNHRAPELLEPIETFEAAVASVMEIFSQYLDCEAKHQAHGRRWELEQHRLACA